MIITDLTYQEIAADATDLEGGFDVSFNTTNFTQRVAMLQTGSTSGPGGSTSMSVGGVQNISTAGLTGLGLSFPSLSSGGLKIGP